VFDCSGSDGVVMVESPFVEFEDWLSSSPVVSGVDAVLDEQVELEVSAVEQARADAVERVRVRAEWAKAQRTIFDALDEIDGGVSRLRDGGGYQSFADALEDIESVVDGLRDDLGRAS